MQIQCLKCRGSGRPSCPKSIVSHLAHKVSSYDDDYFQYFALDLEKDNTLLQPGDNCIGVHAGQTRQRHCWMTPGPCAPTSVGVHWRYDLQLISRCTAESHDIYRTTSAYTRSRCTTEDYFTTYSSNLKTKSEVAAGGAGAEFAKSSGGSGCQWWTRDGDGDCHFSGAALAWQVSRFEKVSPH